MSEPPVADDPVGVRPGGPGDDAAVLGLWDEAVAWLVARGQAGQWGTEPPSKRERNRELVRRWTGGAGVRIATSHGEPVGALVLGHAPVYVEPAARPERYVEFLVTSRRRAGRGIGAVLLGAVAAEARAGGAEMLRVDCWADAPALVAFYEGCGFERAGTFVVGDGWRGQVLGRELGCEAIRGTVGAV